MRRTYAQIEEHAVRTDETVLLSCLEHLVRVPAREPHAVSEATEADPRRLECRWIRIECEKSTVGNCQIEHLFCMAAPAHGGVDKQPARSGLE